MLKTLRSRIPDKRNIVTVYAVAMFLVYTWTLLTSFWKLPSWLFFLQVGEIISIYAYALVVDFIESIILLCIALLPALLLPRKWWTERFISRGFAFILIILGSAVLHISLYRTPDTRPVFVSGQLSWWIITFVLAVILTWTTGRVGWLRRGLENLSDRFVVFLYIYSPITLLAFCVLLARILL